MDRIDIKEFKKVTRYKMVKDTFIKVEEKVDDLEFYSLDKEAIEKLLNQKDIDNLDNFEFLFLVIPILSNVDMTLNKKEFFKMCKNERSLRFTGYVELLMSHIVSLCEVTNSISITESKIKNFAIENNIEIPLAEPVKSKSEVIEDLYKEIEECKDRIRTKEIMSEINKLEADTIE